MAKNAYFVVVAYDIRDDRRRLKVMNTLLDFGGKRVNYSVFECLLPETKLVKAKREIERIIDKKKDNIRYYILCEACIKLIETQGVDISTLLQDDDNAIFV
ncbi:MAG: CRISPR-associated endonuclease Cas2 [Deferribacteres bacterium]|nr:CRISPR-associated endonuclease Cas2 [Deferribacteres bacterium]